MTLYLSHYRHQIPKLKIMFERDNSLKAITLASVATGVPIVIVCYFYGELNNFTPELLIKIKKLIKFYKIESIED